MKIKKEKEKNEKNKAEEPKLPPGVQAERVQQIDANALIEQNKKKLSTWKKVWFWLTCWRPVTKYELAKNQQAWLRIGIAVMNNHNLINKVILQLNTMTLAMRGRSIASEGKKDKNENDDEEDVMYG